MMTEKDERALFFELEADHKTSTEKVGFERGDLEIE